MSGIRTTNFNALLASVPQDKLAAIVVKQPDSTGFDAEKCESLRALRLSLADKLTVMNSDGVPKSDPRRKVLALRVRRIEVELRELKLLQKREKNAPESFAPETFDRVFVVEAKRLLSPQQFNEIVLAARGALTVPTDPKDMWEPVASRRRA